MTTKTNIGAYNEAFELSQDVAIENLESGDHKTSKKLTNFQKYAERNSVGGLPYVLSGSSVTRRILWLIILLGCIAFGLYLLRNSVGKLISPPTSTGITNDPNLSLEYPAVTVCSLNWFSAHLVNDPDVVELLQEAYLIQCTQAAEKFPASLRNTPIGAKIFQNVRGFISCSISETIPCSESDFDVSISSLGVCYTFNSGKHGKLIHKANTTGYRESISFLVHVDEDDYVASFGNHVGVKVIVHPQSEPPLPESRGLLVAPGTRANIAIRKRVIDDKTKQHCTSDTSYASCINDQFYTRLRNNCSSCFSRVVDEASANRAVNTCPFTDLCCYLFRFFDEIQEPCLPQCRRTQFDVTSTSYSRWPAEYYPNFLRDNVLINQLYSLSPELYNYDNLVNNYMVINVYYSTLTVETQTTDYTYGITEFFAEVGGELGLCIGVSIISLFEFIVYILDEIKDRCCKPLFCRKVKKDITTSVI